MKCLPGRGNCAAREKQDDTEGMTGEKGCRADRPWSHSVHTGYVRLHLKNCLHRLPMTSGCWMVAPGGSPVSGKHVTQWDMVKKKRKQPMQTAGEIAAA